MISQLLDAKAWATRLVVCIVITKPSKGVVWVLGNLRGEPHIAVILVATFMKKI
jgi:hypothetical protein